MNVLASRGSLSESLATEQRWSNRKGHWCHVKGGQGVCFFLTQRGELWVYNGVPLCVDWNQGTNPPWSTCLVLEEQGRLNWLRNWSATAGRTALYKEKEKSAALNLWDDNILSVFTSRLTSWADWCQVENLGFTQRKSRSTECRVFKNQGINTHSRTHTNTKYVCLYCMYCMYVNVHSRKCMGSP